MTPGYQDPQSAKAAEKALRRPGNLQLCRLGDRGPVEEAWQQMGLERRSSNLRIPGDMTPGQRDLQNGRAAEKALRGPADLQLCRLGDRGPVEEAWQLADGPGEEVKQPAYLETCGQATESCRAPRLQRRL